MNGGFPSRLITMEYNMVRKYLGKYVKVEKGLFKDKYINGDLLVAADSFAEAQSRMCESMKDYPDVKVWFISPVWRNFE